MMVSPQVLNSSVMYVCFTVGDKATNLCTLSNSSGWMDGVNWYWWTTTAEGEPERDREREGVIDPKASRRIGSVEYSVE